jgi:hypothetical protein
MLAPVTPVPIEFQTDLENDGLPGQACLNPTMTTAINPDN